MRILPRYSMSLGGRKGTPCFHICNTHACTQTRVSMRWHRLICFNFNAHWHGCVNMQLHVYIWCHVMMVDCKRYVMRFELRLGLENYADAELLNHSVPVQFSTKPFCVSTILYWQNILRNRSLSVTFCTNYFVSIPLCTKPFFCISRSL